MCDISKKVRKLLKDQMELYFDHKTPEDVYRVFQQEAYLLQESEATRTHLLSDPFENLAGIQAIMDRLCKILRVKECHRVSTKSGYISISAVVRLDSDEAMTQNGVKSHVDLTFSYEKSANCAAESNKEPPTNIWYSIEINRDYGPREKLLWCQIFALSSTPSKTPATSVQQSSDKEEDWSDIEEDVEEPQEEEIHRIESNASPLQNKKRTRRDGSLSPGEAPKDTEVIEDDAESSSGEELCDRYYAGMDPEILNQLLHWCSLKPMDEITAFFLLMTFPFYEHEWDIVGFILETVFGQQSDDDYEDQNNYSQL